MKSPSPKTDPVNSIFPSLKRVFEKITFPLPKTDPLKSTFPFAKWLPSKLTSPSENEEYVKSVQILASKNAFFAENPLIGTNSFLSIPLYPSVRMTMRIQEYKNYQD